MNRTIARCRHFTTTTRIIEFLVFLCKLRLLFFLVLGGIDKFKQQSKTEMNSGSCSQISSSCNCPIRLSHDLTNFADLGGCNNSSHHTEPIK